MTERVWGSGYPCSLFLFGNIFDIFWHMVNPEHFSAKSVSHPSTYIAYADTLMSQTFSAYPFAEDLYQCLVLHDRRTAEHSVRTALIGSVTASIIGLEATDIDRSAVSGLLHDIGKLGIPAQNLTRPATSEELTYIRHRHMDWARTLLRDAHCPPDIMHIVMSHHDAFSSNDQFLSGPTYPRDRQLSLTQSDRRRAQTDRTLRIARIVWLADKTDRGVNGYDGSMRKPYAVFMRSFRQNFIPTATEKEPLLFTAAGLAVRHIFYRDSV